MTFRIAVVLPMYNEAGNVEPLFARLAAVRETSGVDLVALAVDDGSRDQTAQCVQQAMQTYPFVRLVRHDRNRGMAAALRTGIAAAISEQQPAFDAVAFMDADLTHAPEDLPRLFEPILRGEAEFVLGSRYVSGGAMQGVPFARRAISVVGNAVARRLLGVAVGDPTSGFRAARTEVLRTITLQENGFGIQMEGSVQAYRAGFRVREVPITLGVRKSGYSKMAYTRSFWLGYGRLLLRLTLSRRRSAVPPMVDLPAANDHAKAEDTQSRRAAL